MSLIRAMLGAGETRSGVDAAKPVRDPALSGWFGGRATASGQCVTPDSALTFAAVYACVRLLAGVLAALPLDLYRRMPHDSREIATDHHTRRRLQRPNSWQSEFEWRRQMAMSVLMRGNGYSAKRYDGRGRLASLVPMHPDRVQPLWLDAAGRPTWADEGDRVGYWYQPATGPGGILFADEVHHWRGLSTSGLTGLSPLRVHRETVGLGLAAQDHGARLFGNGAHLNIVVTHPQVLSDPAFDRLKASFNERVGAGAYKPLLLDEGMAIERLSMTAEEAQFLQTRGTQVEEVCRIYGVPPHLIAATDKVSSWGAGIEQMSIGFVQYTLLEWLTNIEQAMSRDLLTEAESASLYWKHTVAGLLRGDATSRAEYLKTMVGFGVMTRNEARALEELNWAGADLDKYLVPQNMTTTDLLGQPAGGAPDVQPV
ncbi:phage portal protein [Plasticicumulans acidivorans]|uniref:HK97 family phage portal protein n=1 Tax=Plasticicumulans acidivorans TaxID=886464 RepID=A0A317N5I5_9GAMM|nr:phage portal protein [Plasticicumulans acidivorans]PWV66009.1 HK97 family phage portal protein [Plasticicumulans acidivorans]